MSAAARESDGGGRTGRLIEVLVLQSLALQALGEAEPAVECLAQALELARPEGYVRLFADEGEPVADLLRRVLGSRGGRAGHDVPEDHARRLLAAIEAGGEPGVRARDGAGALAEPLSERELEVLRLLSSGMSNREVAQNLFVALSTVKTHVNSIYRKLEARSRTHAVARARELDLL